MSTGNLLLLVIPIVVIQLILVIVALVDLVRRDAVKGGSKALWVVIIIFIGIIGSLLYLFWGREVVEAEGEGG